MTDMNGGPAESGLMRATAKNIENLQRAVVDLQVAASAANADAKAAKEAARLAREEARRWKVLTRVLSFFVVVALVASGLSIYNWVRAVESTNQLRQQAITACQQGNASRAAEVNVWDHVLNEFLAGLNGETPAQQQETVAFVRETEQYLAVQLAPRNCTQAYNANAQAIK
jgi:hypothetical protein